jgi:hypothetical protein
LPRNRYWLQMKTLQGMSKGWAVLLGQDVWSDFDDVVRPNANDKAVEGPMVDRTHRHTIRYNRLATIRIFLDVRSI